MNLAQFEVILPNQIRVELERNLSSTEMKLFYQFIISANVMIDFEKVPLSLVTAFEQKGLKKGDAEIGAYCEWRKITIFISNNRDFLRGLSPGHTFQVMSPAEFCQAVGLQ
jgi:hypothetical protein